MSKTNVLQRPNVDVGSGRHDFDRSYVLNSNQSAGELRPVFCQPVVAGSKGIVNARRFTRSADVVYPAFQQVDQHIDFFMVPLRYLWSRWNDWKVLINDLNSSSLVDWDNNAPVLSQRNDVPRMDFGSEFWKDWQDDVNSTAENPAFMAGFLKLCDDLDYPLPYLKPFSGTPGHCYQNLFKIAAYNKVYYDHYRNSIYEANNPYAYNLDWLDGYNGDLDVTDGSQQAIVLQKMFQMKYVNYRNDYYHNIYPSLDYSLNVPTGEQWSLPSNAVGVGSDLYHPEVLNQFNSTVYVSKPENFTENFEALSGRMNSNSQLLLKQDGVSGSSSLLVPTDNASLGAQQLRAIFALDKLRRASAYAPKHVRQQFEALYGVKISDRVSFESVKLGSLMNDITFGEVTSTTDTLDLTANKGQKLGAISGKGIGASDFGKDIHFYAEEDSIIIGIQYFIPRAMYDNSICDVWNSKLVRSDFFNRAFEHLGLRPMLRKTVYCKGDTTDDNRILGFTEANMEYKVGIDRNKGAFSRYIWYVKEVSGDNPVIDVKSNASLTPFAVHTDKDIANTFIANSNGVNMNYFKVFPWHLDPIFSTAFDEMDINTDQFYGNIRFKFAVNAPMDIHSQPFL